MFSLLVFTVMSRRRNSGYFSWSDELDRILMKCMKNMVDEKKIDHKGKLIAGAYIVLEQMMEHEKPGCGVKGDPNIVSRVKTLKAKFLVVQELRGLSGAGWDDVQKAVDIKDTVYADYVVKHPHCAKLNRVPFPLYDGLAYVFGNTRATGKGAVGPEDLDKGCPRIKVPNNGLLLGWENNETPGAGTEPNEQQHNKETDQENVDSPQEETEIPSPFSTATQSEATSRRKRVRRSATDGSSEVTELTPMTEDAVKSLRSMVDESDTVHRQRSAVFEQVKKIASLSYDQMIDATIRLGKDDSMLEIFFNIKSEEARKALHRAPPSLLISDVFCQSVMVFVVLW
ncbi:hypothetical protein LINPERHAP2_LOCUS28674 [Linum perenne]